MPFTPVKVDKEKLTLLGREITLSASGLPDSIGSKFAPDNMSLVDKTRDVLATPIELLVESSTGKLTPFLGGKVEFISKTDAAVSWKSQSTPNMSSTEKHVFYICFGLSCNIENISFATVSFALTKK